MIYLRSTVIGAICALILAVIWSWFWTAVVGAPTVGSGSMQLAALIGFAGGFWTIARRGPASSQVVASESTQRTTQPIIRFTVLFAKIGGGVAIALLLYDYLFLMDAGGGGEFDDLLFKVLCPPSLALMGLDGPRPGIGLVLVPLGIVLVNAMLYGAVGLLLGSLVRLKRRYDQPDSPPA